MLLGPMIRILFFVLSLLMLGSIVYLSKPDRGGMARCEEVFGLHSLSGMGVKIVPMDGWKPFEKPKFKAKLTREPFELIKGYLVYNGFDEWRTGGIQYGSLNIGWEGKDDLIYSLKKFSGRVHVAAYDYNDCVLYLIVSQ